MSLRALSCGSASRFQRTGGLSLRRCGGSAASGMMPDSPAAPSSASTFWRKLCTSRSRRRAFWRHLACRNHAATPPISTPIMSKRIISANSGKVTAAAGSFPPNGSSETVTICRLATANAMMMTASGTRMIAATILRSNGLDLRYPASAVQDPEAAFQPGQADFTSVPPALCRRNGRTSARARVVKPLAHFLARLEERHALLIDGDMGAGARIAAGTRRTPFHRERAEAAELHAVTACHRRDDLSKDGVDDLLHVTLIEVRIVFGNALYKFGLDHGCPRARLRSWIRKKRNAEAERSAAQFALAGCQRANRPSRLSRSIACIVPQAPRLRASVPNPTASSTAAAMACRKGRSPKRLRS